VPDSLLLVGNTASGRTEALLEISDPFIIVIFKVSTGKTREASPVRFAVDGLALPCAAAFEDEEDFVDRLPCKFLVLKSCTGSDFKKEVSVLISDRKKTDWIRRIKINLFLDNYRFSLIGVISD
jgi:hypothetical protein